ncbi:ribokinase [Corynebacterium sp. H130]|uniref:ribokinase n=1 Tax=Corynebacterium sp. H130 TaxID=3133444 RepID=UPI0030AEEFC9
MKLLVVGGYGVGLSFFTDHAPEAGETLSGARLTEHHGGKASNQAVAASRLGIEVELCTSVGADSFGEAAFHLWETESVGSSSVTSLSGKTMVGCIITEANGENRILLANGVLDDFTPEIIENQIEAFSTDMVLVSCEVPSSTVRRALKLAHEKGARTILNPAPVPELTDEDWANIDVVTPNSTEARQLLGEDSTGIEIPRVAELLAEKYQVAVVVTNGSHGCVVAVPGGTAEVIPAHRAERVVDTTGAGDSFNAGLAAALLHGLDLHQAVKYGTAVGALAVETEGVIPALPTAKTVQERFGLTLER